MTAPAQTLEYNFDSLVGPTHNYAGLAQGNLASQQNRHLVSHPKLAALQGLDKVKRLADLGIPQVVLPPHPRPHLAALRRLGFTGSDAEILARAAKDAPQLLAACCSSSFMWAANAATVAPSADTADGRLHITPANLASHLHRSLEAPSTAAILRQILPGSLFAHHDPLPSTPDLFDEGAANHSRLCRDFGDASIHIFTYGRDGCHASGHNLGGQKHEDLQGSSAPAQFAPRHSRAASEAIARLHQLNPARTFFVRQHPAAIDAGVFHNDVIAVAHRDILVYHEQAWVDGSSFVEALRTAFRQLNQNAELRTICIPANLLPLQDAVRSYLFNSQLLSLPRGGGTTLFLAPTDCQTVPTAMAALDLLREKIPTLTIEFADLRQSMQNGGGPACLRLRVVLTPQEQSAFHPGVLLTPQLYTALRDCIQKHYRDDLSPPDLADAQLLAESRIIQDRIFALLKLTSDPTPAA